MSRFVIETIALIISLSSGALAQDNPTPVSTPDECLARLQVQREAWEQQCDEAVSLEAGKRVRHCEQLLQKQTERKEK